MTKSRKPPTTLTHAPDQQGVGDEIGALRVVMARLLLEEEDLTRLVTGMSRLTSAIVQAARLQRMIEGPLPDPLSDAINQASKEFERPQSTLGGGETGR